MQCEKVFQKTAGPIPTTVLVMKALVTMPWQYRG